MNWHTSAERPKICVIGLGNVFLGDDAFGPLVVEKFRCEYVHDASAEILDLGTPGLDLTPYLHARELVVIVDAVVSDEKPGTLRVHHGSGLLDRPAMLHLTGHDPGLGQCLAQLKLAGLSPSKVIILGVVPECCDLGSRISACVLGAVSAAVYTIVLMLNEHGVPCRRRPVRQFSNLLWQVASFAGQATAKACSREPGGA